MKFVIFVVGADFGPKSLGMIHVVEMGELVQDYVVAKWFGDVHEADIERNGFVAGTTTPTSVGVS